MADNEQYDPFANEGAPAVSFKDLPIGTKIVMIVSEAPKVVQARDFDTGKPAFWPDGNEKKTIVTNVLVDGEERSLWAAIPSSMKTAIAEAQKAADATLAPGGRLTVWQSGEKPNATNPRLNAQKIYSATYEPPNAFEQAAPAVAAAPAATSVAGVPAAVAAIVARPESIPEAVWATLGDDAKVALAAVNA